MQCERITENLIDAILKYLSTPCFHLYMYKRGHIPIHTAKMKYGGSNATPTRHQFFAF